jgi:hypothetical protein
MTNGDSGLNDLFERYRLACPEPEPDANFMPAVWRKIEARRSFRLVFAQLARPLMAGSAALVVLLLILNIVSNEHTRLSSQSYVDSLLAEHTAEKTYYTEAIRGATHVDDSNAGQR